MWSIVGGLVSAAVQGAVSGLVTPVVKAWRSWTKTQEDVARGQQNVEAADSARTAKEAEDARKTEDSLARADRGALIDSLSGRPAAGPNE